MIFEMTDDLKKHLEIIAGEMYLIDNDPEPLKMNEDYRKIYGEDLFSEEWIIDDFESLSKALNVSKKQKNTVKK